MKEHNLPRIGGIATMPSRLHTFRIVLGNILPQLDRLYVFFDKFDAVPSGLAKHPKIAPLHAAQSGDVQGDGKFLGAELFGGSCLYFCFDDDIDYPPNYVEVLTRALYRHRLRALVGFHATLFARPHESYMRDRHIGHFSQDAMFDRCVDELGTGTMAFCTDHFRIRPREWPHHGIADLLVAIEAVKQGLPRISVRRPLNFLRPLEESQPDSLFTQLLKDDAHASVIMRDAVAAYPSAWQRTEFDNGAAPVERRLAEFSEP